MNTITSHEILYVEIYSPMAKSLAFWHTNALGFTMIARYDERSKVSYVLTNNQVCLVLTSTYPTSASNGDPEINSFVSTNYCGVKRIALNVPNVKTEFDKSVANGAVPIKSPKISKDEFGEIEEAAIKLYDNNEIVFINRDRYTGIFKPDYHPVKGTTKTPLLKSIDHIASEVRLNETAFWTNYLTNTIGTKLVQSISRSPENRTGMILKVNQSADRNLTLVIAEPESYTAESKVQQNVQTFGPGIHHLAFSTDDIMSAIEKMKSNDVEFVSFPDSYYTLLRNNQDFKGFDIDALQSHGILIDKEDDTYLLQKFIKPISDRPFFLYELVQRVNGYKGFALKNINVLKKAEEMEVMPIPGKV